MDPQENPPCNEKLRNKPIIKSLLKFSILPKIGGGVQNHGNMLNFYQISSKRHDDVISISYRTPENILVDAKIPRGEGLEKVRPDAEL